MTTGHALSAPSKFGCQVKYATEDEKLRAERLAEYLLTKMSREKGLTYDPDRVTLTETPDGGKTLATYTYTPETTEVNA